MKIRMLSTIDERFRAGMEVAVSPATAARWIARGYATPVRAEAVETAVVDEPVEQAVKRAPKKKRKGKRNVERS
jgi:predicted site-specific integrase-resolvase